MPMGDLSSEVCGGNESSVIAFYYFESLLIYERNTPSAKVAISCQRETSMPPTEANLTMLQTDRGYDHFHLGAMSHNELYQYGG